MKIDKDLCIGIDIGGTNTDAVLVDKCQNILQAAKTLTTENIVDGFKNSIKQIISSDHINKIGAIFVGTTHATNAILQQKNLYTVGLIRIAGNNPELPPCYGWPKEIKDAIYKGFVNINGGFECDGREITKFDKKEVYKAVEKLLSLNVESIAIVGTFSPVNPEQELAALEVVRELVPENFPITISSKVGGISFIERENSTILNCALKKCLEKGFNDLNKAVNDLGLDAKIFIVQNNGTLIDIDYAMQFPILTISAGPTNSFMGGAKLAKLNDCIVIDIGGTSTDAGIINNGFARSSLNNSNIAGINLNFRMPDVLSLALGGGSYISKENQNIKIGPTSSGYKVLEESMAFSGKHLTLTDVSIKIGKLNIYGADKNKVNLTQKDIEEIINIVKNKINYLENRIKGSKQNLKVVIVGGGAQLFDSSIFGPNYIIPDYAHVANAYGAALAEVSAQIDRTISLNNRESIINSLHEEAITLARQNGAIKNLRIIEQQIIPYNYMPNNMARVIITAAGLK